MESITVAVDVDGVLRNFTRGVFNAVEKHRPELRPFLVDDPQDVSSQDLDGFMRIRDQEKFQELNRLVFDTEATMDVFGKAPAYPEALKEYKRSLGALRQAEAEVLICTSQQQYNQKFATVHWLYDHELDFDGLIMAHSNKGSYGLDWILDDKRKNVRDVTRSGGQGVLRARPGNRAERSSVKYVARSLEDYVELIIDSQIG